MSLAGDFGKVKVGAGVGYTDGKTATPVGLSVGLTDLGTVNSAACTPGRLTISASLSAETEIIVSPRAIDFRLRGREEKEFSRCH